MVSELPILAVALPLAGAFALPLAERWAARYTKLIGVAVAAAHVALAAWLYEQVCRAPMVYHVGGWPARLGVVFCVDRAGALFFLVMSASCAGILLFALAYWQGARHKFSMLYFLLVAGMSGLTLTGDAFNFYVFLELTSLSSYGLVALERDRQAVTAALKYMLFGVVSGLLVLAAVLFLYRASGTLNLAALATAFPGLPGRTKALALALLLTGLGLKVAIVPLHFWLPDAHAGAPTPVSALLSGPLVLTWLASLLRFCFSLFGVAALHETGTADLLVYAGCLSIIVGHSLALAQSDLKRLLAYSTVAHLGYVAVGAGLCTPGGVGAGLFHAANHVVMKAGAFLLAGLLIARAGTRRIDELRGMGRRCPWTCALFTVAALALIGLPPANGFFSKLLIAAAAVEGGRIDLATIVSLGAVLSALYFVRLLHVLYSPGTTEVNSQAPDSSPSRPAYVVAGLFAVLCLVVGVLTPTVVPHLQKAATQLLDQAHYVAIAGR